MGSEGPQDVLLATELAHVQAIGVDVLHASKCTLSDEGFQLQNGRVVPEQVAHHQHPALDPR